MGTTIDYRVTCLTCQAWFISQDCDLIREGIPRLCGRHARDMMAEASGRELAMVARAKQAVEKVIVSPARLPAAHAAAICGAIRLARDAYDARHWTDKIALVARVYMDPPDHTEIRRQAALARWRAESLICDVVALGFETMVPLIRDSAGLYRLCLEGQVQPRDPSAPWHAGPLARDQAGINAGRVIYMPNRAVAADRARQISDAHVVWVDDPVNHRRALIVGDRGVGSLLVGGGPVILRDQDAAERFCQAAAIHAGERCVCSAVEHDDPGLGWEVWTDAEQLCREEEARA